MSKTLVLRLVALVVAGSTLVLAAPPTSASPDFSGLTSTERHFVEVMKDAGVTSKIGPDEYIVIAGYLLCRSIYYRSVSPSDMDDIIKYIKYRDFNVVSAIAEENLCPGGVAPPRS